MENPLDNFLKDPNPRKKASDYTKRRGSKRSTTTKKSSNKSSSDQRRRTTSYAVQAKKLPPNFAESVLDHELKVDQGRFTIETINDLILLYSQAVEYYNGMNDERFE